MNRLKQGIGKHKEMVNVSEQTAGGDGFCREVLGNECSRYLCTSAPKYYLKIFLRDVVISSDSSDIQTIAVYGSTAPS